jgi:hypothetical protein
MTDSQKLSLDEKSPSFGCGASSVLVSAGASTATVTWREQALGAQGLRGGTRTPQRNVERLACAVPSTVAQRHGRDGPTVAASACRRGPECTV